MLPQARPQARFERNSKPLGPAFPYIGSKLNFTRDGKYPAPQYPIIIEPFAGSACYSRVYHQHEVILVDLNPTIVRVHRYLQEMDKHVESLPDGFVRVPERLELSARELLGLWAARGASSPRWQMSPWKKTHPTSLWCSEVKQRLAIEAHAIKHWQILHGPYWSLPDLDIEATWFIDAPYQHKPGMYKYDNMDYHFLRKWVLSRRGQVIVCEGGAADWLDFVPLAPGRTKTGQPQGGEVGDDEVWFYMERGQVIV